MSRQLIIGFCTEGETDRRFLESVIQRTFEEVAFDCDGQIDILPLQYVQKDPGLSFTEMVHRCAQSAYQQGVMILCVHADADAPDSSGCFQHKISPAFEQVTLSAHTQLCKLLVAVVPVRMTEAWMLAETDLLKKEIGTTKSDAELGLNRNPESIANPKRLIADAIRIARQDEVKRRRRQLSVEELYLPIGQKVSLTALERLAAYQQFKDAVRSAFRQLNYLH